MRLERSQRLLLQCAKPRVKLVATHGVRTPWPRILAVEPRQLDVVDGRHHPPHIDFGLGRWQVGQRIDEPDLAVEWKGQPDPDEAVLPQIAEIVGVLTIRVEIVGVDRPEQRIVCVRIESPQQLEEPESCLDARWRELEVVRRHVAVRAGAPVAVQPGQASIQKRQPSPEDGVAGLASTIGGFLSRSRAGRLLLRAAGPQGRRWI